MAGGLARLDSWLPRYGAQLFGLCCQICVSTFIKATLISISAGYHEVYHDLIRTRQACALHGGHASSKWRLHDSLAQGPNGLRCSSQRVPCPGAAAWVPAVPGGSGHFQCWYPVGSGSGRRERVAKWRATAGALTFMGSHPAAVTVGADGIKNCNCRHMFQCTHAVPGKWRWATQ